MDSTKSVLTLLGQHFKLSADQSPKTEKEVATMSEIPFANVVGSVMYLMVCSRPDKSYAISAVSRFMSNPGKQHWEALKWILRYLKGSSDVGLVFERKKETTECVLGYVDADYAGDMDKRRSMTGFAFTLWGNLVSWKANLQPMVTLSSTEVEYVAVTEAAKEPIWLRGLIMELGIKQEAVTINCDSQSAVYLCKNQVFHERTKYIDVCLHFIRELIEKKAVKVENIAGSHNPADMFTKPVITDKHRLCMSLLQVMK